MIEVISLSANPSTFLIKTETHIYPLPVEMASDEVVYFFFGFSVEILELMESAELYDIQPVRRHHICQQKIKLNLHIKILLAR